ncbi:unnamed protein product (macronuclear) [Paramecium tetraurelia]|uniref:Serine aminopeptidase S33 domain-containing protein n=1 Tax=Paramecium tetraurelia TaxID=5888 RepID=A0CW27_PARTE|nr:uncharacterized protein GSPATT00001196001 [Paramecium tetraurelia]CAK74994.1 unnamed protein product [Paramecium tetraurelia]|eukprot:XP_001442391.1 hypothetical protein (macronuclear) [Paramecium tetraurelia strain d4-2]
MYKLFRKILTGLFKLLSIIRCLRSTIVQYVAFNPPEVGYLIRNRNEVIKTLTLSPLHEERSRTLDEPHSPLIQAKQPTRQSYQLTKEHLSIISPKIKYYNTLQSVEYKQQLRNPKNQYQYPSQEFNFISNELKAMEIDNNPGLPISSYVLESQSGNLIASIYIEFSDSEQIILYSHGNSTDIGLMFDTYVDIVMECKINLFSYDYSGYGQSTGYPTDINLLYDIESAYIFLIDQLQFEPRNIIIYGYSIGSGPSTNLASRHEVGGLIIHSGLSSGLRVIDPTIDHTSYNDIFPNLDYIVDVSAPVYLLHGGADSMINVVHAEQLAQKAKHLFSVWLVEHGGHGDIESQWKELYFKRLQRFTRNVYLTLFQIVKLHML